MSLTPEQWARLTKPVRIEIERLEADLADARRRLAAGPDNSDTFADPYSETPQPLGSGTHVRFGGPGMHGTIDAYWRDGSLVILAQSGNGPFVVEPRSAGTVFLRYASKS